MSRSEPKPRAAYSREPVEPLRAPAKGWDTLGWVLASPEAHEEARATLLGQRFGIERVEERVKVSPGEPVEIECRITAGNGMSLVLSSKEYEPPRYEPMGPRLRGSQAEPGHHLGRGTKWISEVRRKR